MRKDDPLPWRARVLSRFVHRDARTADGTEVSIWAFPRGIRPSASWSVSYAPGAFWVIGVIFENLRYRIKYRGAWVVEVRNPVSDLPFDDRVLRSRSEALDTVEQMRRRVETVTLDHIGKAFGA